MQKAPAWISRRRLVNLRADYIIGMTLTIGAVLAAFLNVGGAYGLSIIAGFLFYAMATAGWCLLAGYGGMFSLAPSTTVLIGAYVSAILSNAGWPMSLAVVAGFISGALTGLVVALATSRLKGHYFALATLVSAEIVRLAVTNEYQLTGGEAGLRTGPLIAGNVGLGMSAILAVSLMIALTALLFALRGTPGLVVQAIRDDDQIASVRGINVPLVKTLIVVIGSSITAFAGALYVHYIQLATPHMGSLFQTTFIMAIGIIGGVRTMSGPVVGAAIVIFLQEALRSYPFIHMGLMALAILVVCLFAPTGIVGLLLRKLQTSHEATALKERST
jgi:branched-chain amino acid transport system permease protein